MQHPSRSHLALCLPLLLALLLGCGDTGDGVTVTGQVTWNGQPVPEGHISFEDAAGRIATTGGPILDGQYSVADVVPGRKRVQIHAWREGPNPDPTIKGTVGRPYVPARFNSQSELEVDVEADRDNQIPFELEGTEVDYSGMPTPPRGR